MVAQERARRRASAEKTGNGRGGPVLEVRSLKTQFRTQDGVVGESGCGKSMTGLSIMRLIPSPPGKIVAGEIYFNGDDVLRMSDEQVRSIRGNDIAMIFQDPMTSLNPVLTINRQISEALQLHMGMKKGQARERTIELLRMVGIPNAEERVDQYPHQFSGGMRQRVMIAMALSCNPKLLIADEPTTALDVTVQAQILELMKELRERLGMAILLITHDLGVVAEMVDEVAVMYAGRIVERGPVAEIFASPQHPYTEALLDSIPLLGMRYSQPLKAIRGVVPSPLEWPQACRFAPRCDYTFAKCLAEDPPLLPVPPQKSACWLCENGRRVPREAEAIA